MRYEPDASYKAFVERLTPTQYEIIGVRIPILRAMAKEIMKGDVAAFLKEDIRYFEDMQLRAFVIGSCHVPTMERFALIEAFLPFVDNWSTIDSLCSSLKDAKKEQRLYWKWLQTLRTTDEPFTRRFVYVMYLMYFLTPTHIDDVLKQLEAEESDHYYVKMAVAWAVSMAYVKQKERTLLFLQTTTMPTWTYNKALQKTRESLRVSAEEKALLKTMKR